MVLTRAVNGSKLDWERSEERCGQSQNLERGSDETYMSRRRATTSNTKWGLCRLRLFHLRFSSHPNSRHSGSGLQLRTGSGSFRPVLCFLKTVKMDMLLDSRCEVLSSTTTRSAVKMSPLCIEPWFTRCPLHGTAQVSEWAAYSTISTWTHVNCAITPSFCESQVLNYELSLDSTDKVT